MYPSELCDKRSALMKALDTDEAFVPVAADGMTLAMDSIPSAQCERLRRVQYQVMWLDLPFDTISTLALKTPPRASLGRTGPTMTTA